MTSSNLPERPVRRMTWLEVIGLVTVVCLVWAAFATAFALIFAWVCPA